jgi:hypothetical protein
MSDRPESQAGLPSAARADRDLALLARDELRPVRLLLEYLKPELALQDRGVEATIVVFGSTRLVDRDNALRAVDEARTNHDALRDAASEQELRACERRLASAHYYDVARDFGNLAARKDGLTVVTGGGPGLMEAANRGASEAGAPTVGLNIALPFEQASNPYLTPELSFEFRYFALRKLHFVQRARALVAFPGGYGTLDELFDVLTLVQTGKQSPLPIVLVGRQFWDRALDLDFLVDEGLIRQEDRQLVSYAETAEEIWNVIQAWHPSGETEG